jgi:DNA helicase HerA-like ATPase
LPESIQLARLDTRQQALILGHAVPMPVVVRTRDCDESFYRWLGAADDGERKARARKGSQALFGD